MYLCVIIVVAGCLHSAFGAIDWTTVPTTGSTPSLPLFTTSLGSCICDLTLNRCDPNCCCDAECTAVERKSFTRCLPPTVGNRTIRKCSEVSAAVTLMRQSDPAYVDYKPQFDGVVCLYRERGNVLDGRYFTFPVQLSADELQRVSGSTSSFLTQSSGDAIDPSRKLYSVGEPVFVVKIVFITQAVIDTRNGVYLEVPQPGPGGYCTDESFAGYLEDRNPPTPCTRVGVLQAMCMSELSLDRWTGIALAHPNRSVAYNHLVPVRATVRNADTLHLHGVFDVSYIINPNARRPRTITKTLKQTKKLRGRRGGKTKTKTLLAVSPAPKPTSNATNNSTQQPNATATPSPTLYPPLPPRVELLTQYVVDYARGVAVCRNAVVSVNTNIVYVTTMDPSYTTLKSGTAEVMVRDIEIPINQQLEETTTVQQSFGVTYVSDLNANIPLEPKGGNPGYVKGASLRLGQRVINGDKSAIEVPSLPFSLPAGGPCDHIARNSEPVSFPFNTITSSCYTYITAPELEALCVNPNAPLASLKNISSVTSWLTYDSIGRVGSASWKSPSDWSTIHISKDFSGETIGQLAAPYDRVARRCDGV
eukprot:PhF_6_TR37902/c0_g1_i3/m.56600/K19382/TCTN1_3; tectonic-1/3